MRRFKITVLVLICCTTLYSQQQRDLSVIHKDTDDSLIVHAASQWLTAYNGNDLDLLASLYSDDAQYISGHVEGLVANGRDQVIANFAKGINLGGRVELLEILAVNQSCELAAVLCRYEANNNGQKASGRNLLVLKKINCRWVIITHMTVV